jgi:hypothetical protein
MGHHNLVQLSIRCSINPEIRTAGSSWNNFGYRRGHRLQDVSSDHY